MYNIKSKIFTDLTKNQKSDFLSFVKIYTNNYKECDEESIFYNILDELNFYKDSNSGKFEYIDTENEQHIQDLKAYISACKKYIEYKKAQRPLYEAQKRLQKEIRAKILNEKQKKEPPTKKQISYYKSLCKQYNVEMKEIETLSKYDIKIKIQELLEKNNENNQL